jgi:gluconate 2-dehydrogenase gamma chain
MSMESELNQAASLDRRALLQRMALLLGATAIPAEVLAAPKRAAKRFLAAPQFALLSAIADTMIPVTDTPGALQVGVPAKLDGMLGAWASAKTKEMIVGAMAGINAEAKAKGAKSFVALSAAKRLELLKAHDIAALKPGPKPAIKLSGLAAMVGGTPVVNPGYRKLKELVIALYYGSEIASTKELVYEHNPGTFVPSIKITAESRPFAGVGGIF